MRGWVTARVSSFSLPARKRGVMSTSFALVQDALTLLGVSSEEITPNASLLHDLSVDSTEMIEFITIIERQTGVRIDERKMKNINTVAELVSLIENYSSQLSR